MRTHPFSFIGRPADIVKSGLILNYDFLNTGSYPGSGTAITDLAGNSNGSLSSTPAYSSSGYITLDGVSQAIKTNTALGGSFSGSSPNKSESTSLFLWVYPMSGGNILVERGTSSYIDSSWFDSNIEITSGGQFSVSLWTGNLATKVTYSASLNAWYYVGLSYDGSTMTGYVNGTSRGSVNLNRVAPYNSGYDLYYSIGAPTSTNMGTNSYCNMRLGAFQIYNASLSSSSVILNYNAQKGRFGL